MLVQVLSLLVLLTIQHGSTQNCIRDEVTAALAQAGYSGQRQLQQVDDNVISIQINQTMQQGFQTISSALRTELQDLLAPIIEEVNFLRHPGSSPCHPALSCKDIYDKDPGSPSGYYWLQSSSVHLIRVYCDMERTCGDTTGGWMRITEIDMTNLTHSCPNGLRTLTQPKRLCSINRNGAGCSPAHLNVHGVAYSKVCGRIIGYQQKTPDAFAPYYHNRGLTIDDIYVDGISLTYGRYPRKHIWTFAAALQEVLTSYPQALCPCTNINNTLNIVVPPYVGNDYFCDTASSEKYEFRFYPYDPLWDGNGCGPLNTCCTFNNPPWFMKQLPSATSQNIEMRLCTDRGRSDEDITFEQLDLYVQ